MSENGFEQRGGAIVSVHTDLIGPIPVEVVDQKLMVEVRVGAQRFRHDDLAEMQRAFELVCRDLSRVAAGRMDAERREREWTAVAAFSGEHEAIEINDNGRADTP